MTYPVYLRGADLSYLEGLPAAILARESMARAATDSRPRWVIIAGPTGSGKSTLAACVSTVLGIRYVLCTDYLARVTTDGTSHPLTQPTHRAWKVTGGQETSDNHKAGLALQYRATRSILERLAEHSVANVQHLVLEGALLWPPEVDRTLTKYPICAGRIHLHTSFERVRTELLRERAGSTFMHKSASAYGTDALRRYRFLYDQWRHPHKGWALCRNESNLVALTELAVSAVADAFASGDG